MPAPLRDVNLNLLVALDALLSTRSVRRASEHLGITQSAMSHSLKKLRELLGDPLFVRSGNQILPTPRAMELATPLHQALASLQHLVSGGGGFLPERSDRRFVIATPDALAVSLLPALIVDVQQRAQGVELVVTSLDAARIDAQLAAGDVDLVIGIARDRAGTQVEGLFESDLVCLARRDHPGIGAKLDLDTFCRIPHAIVSFTGHGPSAVDEALSRMGRSRRVVLRIGYFLAGPAIAAQSDLLLTLPCMLAEHFAARYSLTLYDLPFKLTAGRISMIWHERFAEDPGLAWLRDRLRLRSCRCPA